MPEPDTDPVALTRAWVERAVVGLNLCPFARATTAKASLRFAVCQASDSESLLADLCTELERLAGADPATLETTLLIHPHVLNDFTEFNDFLDRADAALCKLGLEGVIQLASFHPDYRFAGTEADDIGNATNRSPYPTLHLLREDSIDRAVAAFAAPEAIFEANIRTLEALGNEGWARLQAECRSDARESASSAGKSATGVG